jgi:D-lactate dehydrogenase
MDEMGGISHAEHGIGDYAATDLPRIEVVKLIAHRLLNDIKGIANPGGAWNTAFNQALQDKALVIDGIAFAHQALARELSRDTLLHGDDTAMPNSIRERLNNNSARLLARHQ